jgi:hypothetical protein
MVPKILGVFKLGWYGDVHSINGLGRKFDLSFHQLMYEVYE